MQVSCRILIVNLLASLACAAGAWEVRVTDSAGAAIPQAVVTLTRPGQTAEVKWTEVNGVARWPEAPTADFQIRVEAPGFAPWDRRESGAGSTVFDVRLSVERANASVTVVGEEGYRVPTATVGTKSFSLLQDVPQSIQILNRNLLDDQQAITMADVVRNVSGVNIPNSSGGRMEDFNMRGLTSRAQFKDGFRNDFQSNRAPVELQNVERVEVLKGPSSALYGRMDPSGVVNLVTKLPLSSAHYTAGFQTGSFGLLRPSLDATGPLNRSKTLLYRFNGLYDNSDSFRDFVSRERWLVSPVLTAYAGSRNVFNVYSEFSPFESVVDRGFVAIGNRPAALPASRFLGDPSIPYRVQQGKAGVSWDWLVSPRFNFRSAYRASASRSDYDGRQVQRLLADNRTAELTHFTNDQLWLTHYWVNDFFGRFRTGRVQHNFVVGMDLNREDWDLFARQGTTQRLDIFAPRYDFPASQVWRVTSQSTSTNLYGGGYVQDEVKAGRLTVVAGVRYDVVQLRNNNLFARQLTNARNTAAVPRIGASYRVAEPVSLYVNFAKSFFPNSGTDARGNPFVPERGLVYEVGVKLSLAAGRLQGAVAVFDLTRSGVRTTDPQNPNFMIQVGEQNSRGWETDWNGRLGFGLNLLGSYAHFNPRVTRDTVIPVGNVLLSTPRDSGSLWLTWQRDRGRLRGLGFGGGVFSAGSRWGDLQNTFLAPGYARVDGSVFYRWYRGDAMRARVSFNLSNALNRFYVEGVRERTGVVPGTPRAGQLAIQYYF
jgi:iron complex outermembrane recepter protein